MSEAMTDGGSLRRTVPGVLVADFQYRESALSDSRLFLLLHGFQQNGAGMYRRCISALPEDAAVLAPCGPYPLPKRVEGRYSVGYSWYFYDMFRDEYFIDMEVGKAYLRSLLTNLGLQERPTTIIGFSQGGYLAPFFAMEHSSVDQVIGIGCQFLDEEIDAALKARGHSAVSFRMDQIHGARDAIVEPENARASHRRLTERGVKGEFHLLPEAEHKIDAGVAGFLRQIVAAPRT